MRTEEHEMIPAVEKRTGELRRLCLHDGVRRLDLFGSGSTGRHDPDARDLDFLVEFQPAARANYADSYFGLLEALGRLFGRPVDLLVESAVRNPYFLRSVERTRTPIYEA